MFGLFVEHGPYFVTSNLTCKYCLDSVFLWRGFHLNLISAPEKISGVLGTTRKSIIVLDDKSIALLRCLSKK